MSVPVTIFNANELSVLITVNNGGLLELPGTGSDQNWQPQQPNPTPLTVTDGPPAPNVFGTSAPNQVLVIFGRGPIFPPLPISIPQNQSISSLQLYIFFELGTEAASWVLLNAGNPIASGNVSEGAV